MHSAFFIVCLDLLSGPLSRVVPFSSAMRGQGLSLFAPPKHLYIHHEIVAWRKQVRPVFPNQLEIRSQKPLEIARTQTPVITLILLVNSVQGVKERNRQDQAPAPPQCSSNLSNRIVHLGYVLENLTAYDPVQRAGGKWQASAITDDVGFAFGVTTE